MEYKNKGDLPSTVELYEGFILPTKDIKDLKINGFKYDVAEEVFKGTMEDAEGDLHAYKYSPEDYQFNEVFFQD